LLTTATLLVSGSAPPMPSIWRSSGLPITPSRKASRSAVSAGRSLFRKKPPFDVPPRIHRQGAENPVVMMGCPLVFRLKKEGKMRGS
jgi:hypothetical protein